MHGAIDVVLEAHEPEPPELRVHLRVADDFDGFLGAQPVLDEIGDRADWETHDILRLDEADELIRRLSERIGPICFGGKLTTHRRLAEHAMQELCRIMPWQKHGLTASETLPGGDFSHGIDEFRQSLRARFPWISSSQLDRYVRYYGTRSNDLLAGVQSASDLGRCFGADLCQREVDFLVGSEWAKSAEDIIWRRTKLGLRLTPSEVNELRDYLAQT